MLLDEIQYAFGKRLLGFLPVINRGSTSFGLSNLQNRLRGVTFATIARPAENSSPLRVCTATVVPRLITRAGRFVQSAEARGLFEAWSYHLDFGPDVQC